MNEFIDAEIHTYDIYQSRGDFKFQDHLTKITLLNKLEFMINRLEKNFRKNIGITYGEVKAQHG